MCSPTNLPRLAASHLATSADRRRLPILPSSSRCMRLSISLVQLSIQGQRHDHGGESRQSTRAFSPFHYSTFDDVEKVKEKVAGQVADLIWMKFSVDIFDGSGVTRGDQTGIARYRSNPCGALENVSTKTLANIEGLKEKAIAAPEEAARSSYVRSTRLRVLSSRNRVFRNESSTCLLPE